MSKAQNTAKEFTVSDHDKELINSLLTKINNAHYKRITVIPQNDLPKILDNEEISIINRVYRIDPTVYGFKGPKLPIEPVPATLVPVEPQLYRYRGKEYYTDAQYVPETPYRAYLRMAAAIQRQIGRTLLIESCYRSNAFQAITFLSILKLNMFDVSKTARRAAIPGYSEHTTPSQLAFDLQNVDGLPSNETPQDFEGTKEYNWLVKNANSFGFYLSYPKDNPYGLMFEPWHWRYKPSGNE